MNFFQTKAIPRVLALFLVIVVSQCWAMGSKEILKYYDEAWPHTITELKDLKINDPVIERYRVHFIQIILFISENDKERENLIRAFAQACKKIKKVTEIEIEKGKKERKKNFNCFSDFFTELYVRYFDQISKAKEDFTFAHWLRLKELGEVGIRNEWFNQYKVRTDYLLSCFKKTI